MLLSVGLVMVHQKFNVFHAVADAHLTLWTERLLKVKGWGTKIGTISTSSSLFPAMRAISSDFCLIAFLFKGNGVVSWGEPSKPIIAAGVGICNQAINRNLDPR